MEAPLRPDVSLGSFLCGEVGVKEYPHETDKHADVEHEEHTCHNYFYERVKFVGLIAVRQAVKELGERLGDLPEKSSKETTKAKQ